MSNAVVRRLTLVYFLIQVGFYGINIWLRHAIKTITSGSSIEVGLITAIPYVLAMFGLWYNAKAADRSGRYSTHVLLSMAVGAVALVASVATGDSVPFLAVTLISIAVAGALAYDGPFWASASRAMPAVVAGTAMGLINAVGNLGGFIGPYVGGYLQDVTHGSFLATSIFLACCLLAAGLVMLTLRRGGDRPVESGRSLEGQARGTEVRTRTKKTS